MRSSLSSTHDVIIVTPFNHNVHHRGHCAAAACGSLKPLPAERLRGTFPHLSYSMTLARLLDTTCHTTVHAGPHTAVRRIKLRPHDHEWKSELGKVGVRQSDGESGRVRNPPGAVRTPGRGCREVLTDAPLAKFAKPCPSALPLLPYHRPKSTA